MLSSSTISILIVLGLIAISTSYIKYNTKICIKYSNPLQRSPFLQHNTLYNKAIRKSFPTLQATENNKVAHALPHWAAPWKLLRRVVNIVQYAIMSIFFRLGLWINKHPTTNCLQSLPFYLFINRKAGGQLGKRLLQKLYTLVEPRYLCDLLYENPYMKLNSTPSSLTLNNAAVCCGGDGTIRWIMDVVRGLNMSQNYSFGIIPLGTGNDLYQHILQSYYHNTPYERRSALDNLLQPSQQLSQPLTALQVFAPPHNTHSFDRWKISITKRHQHSSSSSSSKYNQMSINNSTARSTTLTTTVSTCSTSSFNNYFGLGVDGDITCTYDSIRKQRPYLFFHRLVNKTWFAFVWIYKFFRESAKELSRDIELYVDDKRIDLTAQKLKGVILSNICSYAGGTKLWTFGGCRKNNDDSNNEQWKDQSAEDGLIEIVGLTSLTHLAQVKGGLSKPLPIAQGKKVKIITKVRLPMQVDGEPLIESPSEIEVELLEKVKLIAPRLPVVEEWD